MLLCPISHVVIMLYREPPANHQISQASQTLDEIGPSWCRGIDRGTGCWLVQDICKELGEVYFSRAYYRTLKYLAAKHCRLPRMQLVRKVPLICPHCMLVVCCLIWQQTAALTSMTAVTFTMTFANDDDCSCAKDTCRQVRVVVRQGLVGRLLPVGLLTSSLLPSSTRVPTTRILSPISLSHSADC